MFTKRFEYANYEAVAYMKFGETDPDGDDVTRVVIAYVTDGCSAVISLDYKDESRAYSMFKLLDDAEVSEIGRRHGVLEVLTSKDNDHEND